MPPTPPAFSCCPGVGYLQGYSGGVEDTQPRSAPPHPHPCQGSPSLGAFPSLGGIPVPSPSYPIPLLSHPHPYLHAIPILSLSASHPIPSPSHPIPILSHPHLHLYAIPILPPSPSHPIPSHPILSHPLHIPIPTLLPTSSYSISSHLLPSPTLLPSHPHPHPQLISSHPISNPIPISLSSSCPILILLHPHPIPARFLLSSPRTVGNFAWAETGLADTQVNGAGGTRSGRGEKPAQEAPLGRGTAGRRAAQPCPGRLRQQGQ